MTPLDEALARAESAAGVPNEGDFALLAREVRGLRDDLLAAVEHGRHEFSRGFDQSDLVTQQAVRQTLDAYKSFGPLREAASEACEWLRMRGHPMDIEHADAISAALRGVK